MMVKNFVVILILNVALICDVIGTSYSNVHVKSQVVPMEYYQYGTPYASVANPRLSDISSLPSLPGYVAPCESPCVYPAQTIATVTSMNPIPTYKVVPSVPVIVTPTKEEATGYEYSYVVYDENTGDHKAQRELSDGSVVQGEYSFLQPDGYIREVQYVADDISGFNAVVKNFLPVAAEGKKKDEAKDKHESPPPCNEIKNESLKEGSEEESVKFYKIHFEEDSVEESKEHQYGKPKDSAEEQNSKEKLLKSPKTESEEESHKKQLKKPKDSKEVLGARSEEKSTEKHDMKSKYSLKEFGDEFEEKPNKLNKISTEDSDKVSEENSKESKLYKESTEPRSKDDKKSKKDSKESYKDSGERSESQEPKEELKENSLTKKSKESEDESREKYKTKSKKGSKESVDVHSEDRLKEKVSHDKHKEAHELVKPKQEALVPYNDVIRCIQAAIKRNNGIPVAMTVESSPLTYIVLNKPC